MMAVQDRLISIEDLNVTPHHDIRQIFKRKIWVFYWAL